MTVRTVAPSELYSRLAPTYREDFEVPHRKAYDQLAVEAVRTALEAGSTVVDVGCGVGRWVEWLIDDGHDVIGIEPSPGMAAVCRKADFGPRFELQELDVDSAVIGAASVDAVVKQLRLVGDARHALFMIDRELSQRSAAGAAPSGGSAT